MLWTGSNWCLWSELLLKTVLRTVVHAVYWGHEDVCGLSFWRRPCLMSFALVLPSKAMWISVICAFSWSHVGIHEPDCAIRDHIGIHCSCTRDCLDVFGLCCHWRTCWSLWHVLMMETMWMSGETMSKIHAHTDCRYQGSYFFVGIND